MVSGVGGDRTGRREEAQDGRGNERMAAGFVEGSTTAGSVAGPVTETRQNDELIQLNLPKDTEVAVLVEYVSKRLLG